MPPLTSDGGVVFASSKDGHVYALDATTGKLLWKLRTRGPETFVALDHEVVYVSSVGSDSFDGRLTALDSSSGEVLWRFDSKGRGYFTPPAVGGGLVYVVTYVGDLLAIDSRSGQIRWQQQVSSMDGFSPAVSDGVLYVTGGIGNVYALEAATGKKIWHIRINLESTLPLRKGKLVSGLKSDPEYARVLTTPVVYEGVVYLASSFGDVIALNAANGAELWRYQIGGLSEAHSFNLVTPRVVKGVLYAVSDNGTLHALDALTGKAYWHYEAGGKAFFSPTVSQGVIYFTTVENAPTYRRSNAIAHALVVYTSEAQSKLEQRSRN